MISSNLGWFMVTKLFPFRVKIAQKSIKGHVCFDKGVFGYPDGLRLGSWGA